MGIKEKLNIWVKDLDIMDLNLLEKILTACRDMDKYDRQKLVNQNLNIRQPDYCGGGKIKYL